MELKSHFRKIMELHHPRSTCVSTCGCVFFFFFCVHIAVVLKSGRANGSLNDCAQGGVDLFAKAAAFMNVRAFASMMVRARHVEGMRFDLHQRVQEFEMLKRGCNLF